MQAAIERVTLYRNGALVVRRGRAEPGLVVVDGLPLLFSSDSLRVRSQSGEVRDVAETCALTATEKGPPASEEQLRSLAEREARVDDELATLSALVKAHENVKPGEPGRHPPEALPDARAWIDAQAFAEKELRALEERRAALQREKQELTKARRLLERQDQGDTEPPRFSRGVRFTFLAESAADVEVEYFVSAARWVPTYTLHLEGERATLALAALVAQGTGEDWRGAKLSFSTADLARETTLPELLSWRIGRAQQSRRPSFRPLPGDLDELFHGYDRDAVKSEGETMRRSDAGMTTTSAGVVKTRGSLDDLSRRAALAAPRQRAPAAPPAEELLDSVDEDFDDEMPAQTPAYASAAPSFDGATMTAAAPRAAKRAMSAGGRAPGAPPPPSVTRAPTEPLPPRLRHAYLRLQGPDEPGRGTLRPVDPLRQLWDLVEDHDSASYADLQRAVEALYVAAASVTRMTPPAGTRHVPDDSFLHVYASAGEHDVPTDGSYHRVLVERREAEAQIDFRAVPREATEVYRYCTLLAPQGAPLLPGPLHVYEDGAFRVTSRIEGTGGGKRIELNLGVEPALRILGRTVQMEQQEKGLVSQRSRAAHEVTIQIRSGLPRPATLVLYDRLPVPDENEKEIEVTLESSSPEPTRDDKDPRGHPLPGGMRFVVTVPANERAKVVYGYVISLPAKTEVLGGNRRE